MKDKYIRSTEAEKTILNLRHPETGHYAEIASGEDDKGSRWFAVPMFGKVFDWPTARAKCIKIFTRAGYQVVA